MAMDPKVVAASAAFARWRHTKSGARPRTPDRLKQLAVGLLKEHSLRSIADALSLSCNTLRVWRDNELAAAPSLTVADADAATEVEFIEVSPTPVACDARIEIVLPSGLLLKIPQTAAPAYVARLCAAFRHFDR